VIRVVGVVEPTARAGFQIIDPSQALRFNKVLIQPEPVDDQPVRGPADGALQIGEIAAQEIADDCPAGIVVAAIEQHALPAGSLVRRKTPHYCGAAVDVTPAAGIGARYEIFCTDRREQVLEVDLFDEHLDTAARE
jgi:hypothetical protein